MQAVEQSPADGNVAVLSVLQVPVLVQLQQEGDVTLGDRGLAVGLLRGNTDKIVQASTRHTFIHFPFYLNPNINDSKLNW